MSDHSRVNDATIAKSADPTQTTVVFAGNLADDDRVWVVRCSVGELRNMFLDPLSWVASLASLPTWDPKIPAPRLTSDYAVLAERTATVPLDGWLMVQGISGTNAITVVASETSAVLAAALEVGQVPNVLATFWARVAVDGATGRKKALKMELLGTFGRWFGHMEVGDSVSTPVAVATRTSAFLLASLYDVVGCAAMLSTLEQEISVGQGGTGAKPAKVTIHPPSAAPTSTLYASRNEAGEPRTDPTPPTFCVVYGGPYDDPGDATIQGGTIKRYGVDGGDPGTP